MTTVTQVDDTDTSALTYLGEWDVFPAGVDDNTMHRTNETGANVTLSFSGALAYRAPLFNLLRLVV